MMPLKPHFYVLHVNKFIAEYIRKRHYGRRMLVLIAANPLLHS